MPIYEFLCPSCNRVYSFLSQTYEPERRPACPRCGAADLERVISRFAFISRSGSRRDEPSPGGQGSGGPGEGGDPLDDPRVEAEMMRLMADAEHMDENDPRQLGRLMRRMSEISGEPMDEEMTEAVRRLEAGEDPEKVEEDMGGLFGDEGGPGQGPPTYDDGLYSL